MLVWNLARRASLARPCSRQQQSVQIRRPTSRGPRAGAVIPAASASTSPDRLAARFKLADKDGNGRIDRQELRTLMESMEGGSLWTKHWMTDDELDAVMDTYDKDKNGTLDYDEFKQIVTDGLLLEGALHEYEDAFTAVDSSKNGAIGANELARMLSQMGQAVKIDDLVDIFQKYDLDESGQIEFGEFLKMFRDKVLDLKAMKEYMKMLPSHSSRQLMAPPSLGDDGDFALVFSEQELDEVLDQGQKSGRVVAVFGSVTWCRPCKAMERPVLKLADAYKDSVTFVKLVANANGQTKNIFLNRMNARSTPCFVVFQGTEAVFSMTGANKEKLEDGLRSVVPEDKLPPRVYEPTATASQ